MGDTAVPSVERRRWPRRSRHHEGHVAWKHVALYASVVLLVTFLGGFAIWSYFERQSLVIVPHPLPRLTLVTADPRSPLTAAWVRLLTDAAIEPALVPASQAQNLQGVVALCDLSDVPAPIAASIAQHLRRGGGVLILGAPPATPIGPLHLAADRGTSDDGFKVSESPSPILARLNPGSELPARRGPVPFLSETPRMHVDARWRVGARAAVMHMDLGSARVLWFGLQPDAVPESPALLLMLRTGVRWLGGQPVSDGAVGDATQAAAMAPAARRLARSERFAFSVEPLRDGDSFGVRMANRWNRPIASPTVQVWLPPGASRVALGGDWIMRRGATLSADGENGACVISLPSLGRDEERLLKLRAR